MASRRRFPSTGLTTASEPEGILMTLESLLPRKLADWRPDSASDRLTVDDPAGGWRATVHADVVETVGSRLREVGVARLAPLADPAPLLDRARGLADRVTGLLEPLRLVEVDAHQDVAQLRSDAPAVKGETLAYYEVTLHGHGAAQVKRYEAGHGGKREAVPFTLTHEALGKLVGDLTDQ
jgi:hypothetical protein